MDGWRVTVIYLPLFYRKAGLSISIASLYLMI